MDGEPEQPSDVGDGRGSDDTRVKSRFKVPPSDTKMLSEKIQLEQMNKWKKSEREEKARILAAIQEDKEEKRRRAANTRQQPRTVEESPQPLSSPNSVAVLQVRLLDGAQIRHKLSYDTTLRDLYELVQQSCGSSDISLIQPFPHRTFARDDTRSIAEAGLTPSASLTVVKPLVADSNPVQESSTQNNPTIDDDQDTEMHDEESAQRGATQPRYRPFEGGNIAGPQGMYPTGIRTQVVTPFVGQGRRITDDVTSNNPVTTDTETGTLPEDSATRRALALNFLSSLTTKSTNPVGSSIRDTVRRPVLGLRVLCLQSCCSLLANPSLPDRLFAGANSLQGDVADLLVSELAKTKRLDGLTVRRLRKAGVGKWDLDGYALSTDGLLQSIGTWFWESTVRVSLRGCSFITDAGVVALEPLRSLQHLDLSSCRITDGASTSIARMPELKYLNLSATKVTNKGLRIIASGSTKIDTLILAGCAGVGGTTIFSDLHGLPNLVTLSLSSTKLASPLTPFASYQFKHIRSLSLRRTMISDDDLRKVIAGLVNLEELEISECHAVSVAGIRIVLQTLKHLRAFNFPTKEVNCDEVLREMARMPLPIRELNLEMANVTDEGLMSIAGLANSLERLALAGCKNVTNEGFKFLGRLAHVEDLDLDRLPQIESTPMAELLRNLPSVTSLSVSATKVDDNFLSMVADAPFARVCKKLNLSRTRITDEGLRNLHSFTKLSMVNLDGNPGITIEALSILAKLELPALVPPRLRISAPQQQQQQVHDEDHVEMDM